MLTEKSYLLVIISICIQVVSLTDFEITNQDDLLENHFHHREHDETRVSPQIRITPIMFTKPYSDNNTCSSALDEFPSFFTEEQRKQGAIIISFLVAIYCFTLMAILCDSYFVPCVERICEALNLSQDVAAATFMAMATSAPELFVNIIGTFVTESDIGLGTVVGSSMFNTLGVAALGGLAAIQPIKVDWWPVTRDCTLYMISISMLVLFTWDGVIFWYEGLVLFIMYLLYFVIMFNNKRISKVVKKLAEKCSSRKTVSTEELSKPELSEAEARKLGEIYYIEEGRKSFGEYEITNEKYNEEKDNTRNDRVSEISSCEEAIENENENKESRISKLFKIPKGTCFKKFFFFYAWPIKVLLFCTVPNPKASPKLFPLTFIMCIVFMAANSYIISWMITVIGHTFKIPDAVLGLTFLAAGGCLPEAMSVVIMSRKGEGRMGVSNALGANTMNILLSLGLPWFIKTLFVNAPGTSFIEITSGSLEYVILGLMLVAFALYFTLYLTGFTLAKKTGIILIIGYLCSLTAAITAELLLFDIPNCNTS